MWLELPPLAAMALNVIAWLVIQLTAASAGLRLPLSWFTRETWLTRPFGWELGGRVYERALNIRAWKDRLPDAGSRTSRGFPKSRLRSRDTAYLVRFAAETRRGEWVHWTAAALLPLFLLWNDGAGFAVNAVYAVLANLPCILVQRYNRMRLTAAAARRSGNRAEKQEMPDSRSANRMLE